MQNSLASINIPQGNFSTGISTNRERIFPVETGDGIIMEIVLTNNLDFGILGMESGDYFYCAVVTVTGGG